MSDIDTLLFELRLFNRVEWVGEQMDKMTWEEREHHHDVCALVADSLADIDVDNITKADIKETFDD